MPLQSLVLSEVTGVMRTTRTSQRVREEAAYRELEEEEGVLLEGVQLPEHLSESGSEVEEELETDKLDPLDSVEDREAPDTGGPDSVRPATTYKNPVFGLEGTPEVRVAKTPANPFSAPLPKVRFSGVKVLQTPPSRHSGKTKKCVQSEVPTKQAKGKARVEVAPPPETSDSSSSSESASVSDLGSDSEAESSSEEDSGAVLAIPRAKSNPFPRGPRGSATPKLFTPVRSKEFEYIVEHSYYQQFEAEVLISVLSYLHD